MSDAYLTRGALARACRYDRLALAVPQGTDSVTAYVLPDHPGGDRQSLDMAVSGDVARTDVLTGIEALGFGALGTYELLIYVDGDEVQCSVEVVGSRYCTRDDLVAYGKASNDGFEDAERYPDTAVQAAISAAEQTIDRACGRSFCKRSIDVRLRAGRINELPVVDAYAIEGEGCVLVTDRQAVCATDCVARVEYGTRVDDQVRRAAVLLAAWYLRPKAQAENARGQSVDGVFVGFELATGAEGSWTGLPEVDAFIEQRRSRRRVVM